MQGGGIVIDIDFDNLNEEAVYKAFHIDGNESEALNTVIWDFLSLSGGIQCLSCLRIFPVKR